MHRFLPILIVLLIASSPLAGDREPTPQELEQEVSRMRALTEQKKCDASCMNALGYALYRLERHQEALEAFSLAIAANPSFAVAHNNLGAVHMRLKDYPRAETAFGMAIKIDPNHIKAAYNLSVALYRQKKYLDAYKAYQHAKSIDAAYVQKRFDESGAEKELNNELKKDPENGALRVIVKGLHDEK